MRMVVGEANALPRPKIVKWILYTALLLNLVSL